MISRILFPLVFSTFIKQNIFFPETYNAFTISEPDFTVWFQNTMDLMIAFKASKHFKFQKELNARAPLEGCKGSNWPLYFWEILNCTHEVWKIYDNLTPFWEILETLTLDLTIAAALNRVANIIQYLSCCLEYFSRPFLKHNYFFLTVYSVI